MAYALTKCFKCQKVISGQSREIGKRTFHFDCLTCTNCKMVIGADDNGKIRDNRIFCKPCFTKRYRPECDACRQPIAEGDGLKAQGKTLHTMCFRCAGCQRPMGPGKQVSIKNEIYCQIRCQQERVAREKAAAAAEVVPTEGEAAPAEGGEAAAECVPAPEGEAPAAEGQ